MNAATEEVALTYLCYTAPCRHATAAATLATLATTAAAAAAIWPPPWQPAARCCRCLILCACPPAHAVWQPCMLLAHVLCRARVLLWQMVKRGELAEPTTAAHLSMLTPLRVGGKMTAAACTDPSKAKYLGMCHSGTRVWGDLDADMYRDGSRNKFAVFCCGACKLPLPLPPAPVAISPVTLTGAQIAAIEEKRQAALARKRAREESPPPTTPVTTV